MILGFWFFVFNQMDWNYFLNTESSEGQKVGWWLRKSSQMPEDSVLLSAGPYYIHIVFRLAQGFCPFANPPNNSVADQLAKGRCDWYFPHSRLPFSKVLHFPIYGSAYVIFLKNLFPVSMGRDADSLLVKCHFNSLLPFMEYICRSDFSAQKVRRKTEVSKRTEGSLFPAYVW